MRRLTSLPGNDVDPDDVFTLRPPAAERRGHRTRKSIQPTMRA
jgi:hypothetical protein